VCRGYPLSKADLVLDAGVIMLCIMTGHYPVFTATDEYVALIELVTFHGWDKVRHTAEILRMCRGLREGGCCLVPSWSSKNGNKSDHGNRGAIAAGRKTGVRNPTYILYGGPVPSRRTFLYGGPFPSRSGPVPVASRASGLVV
jgi:hypothetical protein